MSAKSIQTSCRQIVTPTTQTDKMVLQLKKVLISDDIDAKCVNILQSNGVDVVKNTKLSKAELIAEIPVSKLPLKPC